MARTYISSLIALMAATALIGAAPASSPPAQRDPGYEVDAAITAGDDFYRFANGPWLRANRIPAGASSYDTSAMLRQESAVQVRGLIAEATGAARPQFSRANRNVARQIGDYYAAQMDTAAIEAKQLAPLNGELEAIRKIANRQQLSAYLGRTLRLDDGTNSATEGVFGLWVHQGFTQADHYTVHLVQGGLGLPDADDYSSRAPEKAAQLNLYREHVAAVLKLAGFDRSDERAANVLSLESAIMGTHGAAADAGEPLKVNHVWRRADFDSRAPGLDWTAYFAAAGILPQTDFTVWQPSAVIGTSALVESQPLAAWRDYLAFHLIDHYSLVLPKALAEEHRRFLAKLTGAAQSEDRAAEALAATTAALGDGIGRLYVERYFPPRAKQAAVEMAENIRAAYNARLARTEWMSPQTRDKARQKLAALQIGIGNPDAWIDYSPVTVLRGDAFGNLRRAESFAYRLEVAKLNRPVDPAEWTGVLYPQTVGAIIYFNPNTIQFSAALFQPPFFDFAGDAASNYGSAGAGMAHEISHSFDALGNGYDDRGLLSLWWTPEDSMRYGVTVAPLAAQFGANCPLAALCLKGDQVLGESVADLVGLEVAHDAYVLSLKGKPDVVRNGFTGEQRFFLAFARRWRSLKTDAALRKQVMSDTHPPGEYRSDTVRNIDGWYRAFDVKPADRLYLTPAARVRLW